MVTAIADTHPAIWYLYTDPRLSSTADTFMQTIEAQGQQIGISSITLVEMVYLIEKGRIPVQGLTRLAHLLADPDTAFVEVPG